MSGIKHDQGKLRMELLSVPFLEELSKALTFGANKYSDHNWRKGFLWSRLYGALLRHVTAHMAGENKDPESGLSHLAHASACLQMLVEHEVTGIGEDDRYVIPKKQATEDRGTKESKSFTLSNVTIKATVGSYGISVDGNPFLVLEKLSSVSEIPVYDIIEVSVRHGLQWLVRGGDHLSLITGTVADFDHFIEWIEDLKKTMPLLNFILLDKMAHYGIQLLKKESSK